MTGSSVLFDAPGPRARKLSLTLSIVAGAVLLGGIVWIFLTLNAPRQSGIITVPGMFDGSRWNIFDNPRLWLMVGEGVLATLRAAVVAAILALLLGVVFALLRTSATRWVRIPITIVLEFVRGMPVLLMMLFIVLAAHAQTYTAVVLALGIYNGAIIGEALRSGIMALPKGQREAGLSIGLSGLQTRLRIEFPQAFTQMLPIIVAQLVVLLKDTSLGYIVGYAELLRVDMTFLSSYYGSRYMFSFFIITFVIYLAMNLTLSWFARRLARRGDPALTPRRLKAKAKASARA